METNGLDQRLLAEEIAVARQKIDSTLVMLRTQLQSLNNKIITAMDDIEKQGMAANFNYLNGITEQSTQVERYLDSLKDKKKHMQQIMMHVQMIRDG